MRILHIWDQAAVASIMAKYQQQRGAYADVAKIDFKDGEGFTEFMLITGGVIIVLIGLFGYFWLKRSKFFKAEIQINVEANQYQTEKLTPVTAPLTEALVQFLEKEGINCQKVKEILEKSKA